MKCWIKRVEDAFESLQHGETLTKFIAWDKGRDGGDFTVEIHGFVDEQGQLIITHEKVEYTTDHKG